MINYFNRRGFIIASGLTTSLCLVKIPPQKEISSANRSETKKSIVFLNEQKEKNILGNVKQTILYI